jgi:uncharacterized membrane protein
VIAAVAHALRCVRIVQAIEIELPARDVALQWTRFDWRSEVAGPGTRWRVAPADGAVVPRIAWRCRDGARVRGIVDFRRSGQSRTSVALRFDRAPAGLAGRLTGSLGLLRTVVARELRRFKEAVETRHHLRARRDLQRRELERFRALTKGR